MARHTRQSKARRGKARLGKAITRQDRFWCYLFSRASYRQLFSLSCRHGSFFQQVMTSSELLQIKRETDCAKVCWLVVQIWKLLPCTILSLLQKTFIANIMNLSLQMCDYHVAVCSSWQEADARQRPKDLGASEKPRDLEHLGRTARISAATRHNTGNKASIS